MRIHTPVAATLPAAMVNVRKLERDATGTMIVLMGAMKQLKIAISTDRVNCIKPCKMAR